MIFTELTLKNFFRYGNNEQTFQRNRNGIWNITGLNGYGKSTIIEAIVWCLFGKTRQEKVEDVVNRKTKKDCKVSVSFTDEKNISLKDEYDFKEFFSILESLCTSIQ